MPYAEVYSVYSVDSVYSVQYVVYSVYTQQVFLLEIYDPWSVLCIIQIRKSASALRSFS